jgi:CheY-like chemotaxis protein
MARILVADDDSDTTEMQRQLLQSLGYEVVTATSPPAALEEVRRGPLDLIVVDLRFPRVEDGLKLIRDIREAGCRQPILLLSGCPDDLYGTVEESLVTRVLTKGSITDLLVAIADMT